MTYSQAKQAAQARADGFARMPTTITNMTRERIYRGGRFQTIGYDVSAKWSRVDPVGCKGCGYDSTTDTFYDKPTTDTCSADIEVRYRHRRGSRIAAYVTESSCF